MIPPYYYPRDKMLPILGMEIVVHTTYADVQGVCEGIEQGERNRIWLREADGDCHRYDLLAVSWSPTITGCWVR